MIPNNTVEGDQARTGLNGGSSKTATRVESGQELAAREPAATVGGPEERGRHPFISIVKRLLPTTVLTSLRVIAELRGVTDSRYKRLVSVVRALRRAGKTPTLPARVESVAFVCHGNIMRSPVSEAMLRQSLQTRGVSSIRVSSAGMRAIAGRSADPRSLKVAPEFGVSVLQHRAQPMTQALADSSDLVIVMDVQNAAEFIFRFPNASEKVFFLRQFSAQHHGGACDIPDPYPGDELDMRNCCYVLQECVERLAAEITGTKSNVARRYVDNPGDSNIR